MAEGAVSVGIGEVAVVADTEAGGVLGSVWLAGGAVCGQASGTG